MTIGQAAYEKWRNLIPSSSGPTLTWDELPIKARDGWEKVAVAAIEQYALNMARGHHVS